MVVKMSKNGKWVQVSGVRVGDTMLQDALRRLGLRWCNRARHWWGPGRAFWDVRRVVGVWQMAQVHEAQSRG